MRKAARNRKMIERGDGIRFDGRKDWRSAIVARLGVWIYGIMPGGDFCSLV